MNHLSYCIISKLAESCYRNFADKGNWNVETGRQDTWLALRTMLYKQLWWSKMYKPSINTEGIHLLQPRLYFIDIQKETLLHWQSDAQILDNMMHSLIPIQRVLINISSISQSCCPMGQVQSWILGWQFVIALVEPWEIDWTNFSVIVVRGNK